MLDEANRLLLRAELLNDPEGMGYAQAIVAEDWATVRGLLLTGSPGSTRPREVVSRGAFLKGIAASAFRIAGLDANSQRAWDRVLGMIQAAESITVSDPGIQGMLAAGVAQSVVTQAEVDALTREPCPRIEAVLGQCAPITADDLQAALDVSL